MWIIKLYINAFLYFDESMRISLRRWIPFLSIGGIRHMISFMMVGIYVWVVLSIDPFSTREPVNQAVEADIVDDQQIIVSTPVDDSLASNEITTPVISDTPVTFQILTATITAQRLNMRSGPGVSFSVIMKLNQADIVELTGNSENEWFEVTYKGTTGWVHADYIRIERE